jgi:hypothetical protein
MSLSACAPAVEAFLSVLPRNEDQAKAHTRMLNELRNHTHSIVPLPRRSDPTTANAQFIQALLVSRPGTRIGVLGLPGKRATAEFLQLLGGNAAKVVLMRGTMQLRSDDTLEVVIVENAYWWTWEEVQQRTPASALILGIIAEDPESRFGVANIMMP